MDHACVALVLQLATPRLCCNGKAGDTAQPQSLLMLTWRSPGRVKLQPSGKGLPHGDIGGGCCAAVGHDKRDIDGRANWHGHTARGGCDADFREELRGLQHTAETRQ